MTMTIKEIRRERLRHLVDQHGSQATLADRLDIPASYVLQLLAGERNIGDRMARKIESRLGWTHGQMDSPLQTAAATGPQLHDVNREIQIVRTLRLGEEEGHEHRVEEDISAGTVVVPSSDPDAHAMRIVGDAASPAIRDGWVIVLQPNHELVPGEFVLVERSNGVSLAYEYLFERGSTVNVLTPDGSNRITIPRSDIRLIQHISAVISPSQIQDS